MAFKFENLKVWQSAVELSGQISELTKKFPKEELFILTSQLKRATDSISLNIADHFYNYLTTLVKNIQSLRNSIC